MTTHRPLALLLPSHATTWDIMHLVAQDLLRDQRLEPLLLIPPQRPAAWREACQAAGIAFHELSPDPAPPANGLLRRVLRRLHPRLALELQRREHRQRLARQLEQARVVLAQSQARVLVVGNGRLPNQELPFIKAAHELGLPVVVPPVAMPGYRGSLGRLRQKPEFLAAGQPRLARRLPAQVTPSQYLAGDIFFYPPAMTLALDDLDLLPPNPWVLGGGLADLILADGPHFAREYAKEGVPAARIKVVGHPHHDQVHAGWLNRVDLKAGVLAEYGLDPERPLAIMALPQLGEHGQVPWERHWREMRFLAQALRDQGGNALISLHPRMDPDQYQFLESEFRLPIARQRLAAILPAADLFLATFSTTVLWAVLCRIPCLVVDFYDFGYDVYDFITGVEKVSQREEFSPRLAELLSPEGQARRDHLSRENQRWAEELSIFDGRCRQRLVQSLVEVAQGAA